MLGPIPEVQSRHYHCSPILTRPKYNDKRRVIVNLSYPVGASVKYQVTRNILDNRPFTLKFPKIDDIVQEVINIPNDPMLCKIDIARAFCNLRANPVDAVKVGITWAGQWYIDRVMAFGWASGTAAFQMVADAIAHIMCKHNCKIFPYMDEVVMVLSRDIADKNLILWLTSSQNLVCP